MSERENTVNRIYDEIIMLLEEELFIDCQLLHLNQTKDSDGA